MRSFGLRGATTFLFGWISVAFAAAVSVHTPATVIAGQGVTVQTEGSGDATFYLLGPATAIKRDVRLGTDVTLDSGEVSAAGQYKVIACSGNDCATASFQARADQPARLSFFLHPSRVAVSTPNAIGATAFLFDRFYNPVFAPGKVEFKVASSAGAGASRVVPTQHGIAWMRMGSGNKGGAVRITAVSEGLTVPRVIEQVAAEACGLRIKTIPGKTALTLETDPVRDCSGNPLPDGTIVSFTVLDSSGKTTVDAPIKKSVARTELVLHGSARVSVACGVVLGNELSIAGGA